MIRKLKGCFVDDESHCSKSKKTTLLVILNIENLLNKSFGCMLHISLAFTYFTNSMSYYSNDGFCSKGLPVRTFPESIILPYNLFSTYFAIVLLQISEVICYFLRNSNYQLFILILRICGSSL